jgi:hypothetical protein
MTTSLFSFKDAVHEADLHATRVGGPFGFVRGCIACAQTSADLALSAKAAHKQSVPNPVIYIKAA